MKIIFVYNADSGFVNALLDIGHKAISPDTYQCSLCSITHGVLKERDEWKQFRESSDNELVFLHRDEFEKKYKIKKNYPVVLIQQASGHFDELIDRDSLNEMKDMNALIEKLKLISKDT
ncbi:MAG: GTPase [Gammaproteobacteria bacterium]|nr:GTPase [Gammaproteobacteria bacterium]